MINRLLIQNLIFAGVLSKIQKVRFEVDSGNLSYLDLTDSLDVYIVGGSLKLFFRELQEPLIPWDIVEEMHVNLEYGWHLSAKIMSWPQSSCLSGKS